MNKKDLVAKLKQLEGLTPEERAELVNLLNTKKKYGLIWEDKPEDVEEQLRTKLPILREVAEKRIVATKSASETATPKAIKTNLFTEEENQSSDNGLLSEVEAPNHILIEGDNLHALTALTFTHENKIDVIYIDPPYNTGNKDFKYNDAFVDKEDSYRHSKWLSFMHKRLEIAKRLLSEKGVIFISIDDNEQAQLKLLCNEVFGEGNFIAQITWKKKTGSGKKISKVFSEHEYVLSYAKNNDLDIKWRISNDSDGNFQNPDNDELGSWESCAITAPSKNRNINQLYSIEIFYEQSEAPKIKSENDLIHEFTYLNHFIILRSVDRSSPLIYDFYDPITNYSKYIRRWAYIPNSMLGIFQKKRVYLKPGNLPRYKKYEYEYDGKAMRSIFYDDFTTQEGTDDLHSVLPGYEFDYPKPQSLIKYLLKPTTYSDSVILDFFAGSGTTLHATMQLNAEDGGNRQCILVTNNENNICEEVTYERNKRVIQGYTNGKGVQVDGLTNNNLRYYRSEYVGRDHTHKNKKELVLAATELLCIKEDIYTELAELNGHKLDKKTIRCFSDKGRYLMVIYDEETIETLLPLISAIDTHQKIKIYIFAPGQYPFTEEFEDVLDKVELCALPDAIYKAYSNVLPKKKAKSVENSDEESTETGENKEPNLFTE